MLPHLNTVEFATA